MLSLIKYLKPYKKESIIGPLFKLLEACFELAVPVIMANIIDIGIKNQDLNYILKLGGLMIFLGVLGLTCSLTAQYFAAKASMGFGTALRKALFTHIQSFSHAEFDTLGTSTLITRLTSDINQAQAGVNLVLRLFLRSPFIVIGALIMSFTISTKLSLVFVLTTFLLSFVIYGMMFVTFPLYKRIQQKVDKVSKSTRENLVGVRVIRAFSKQKSEITAFQQISEELLDTQLLAGKLSALLNPLTYVLVNLAIIAIIYFGAGQVNVGSLSQGEVIALVNYMTQILLALLAMSILIVSFTKAYASGTRINEIFKVHSSQVEKNSLNAAIEKTPHKVVFEDVSFMYGTSQEASISHISCEMKVGETIGIIGGTGAGKTTLIQLIPRFYDATSGKVLVDGIDVKDYPFDQLRSKIRIVPQRVVLFKGTIRDNMKWGNLNASDEEIYKALDIAQAKDFVDSLEGGLDYMLVQGGRNLSGGQRQRLTIARALVGNPEILILDDSSSALDFATDAALRSAIKEKTTNMLVLIVSQRSSSIKNADHIMVLDDGMLVGYGKHQELLESCDVYKEICLSQLSAEEVSANAH